MLPELHFRVTTDRSELLPLGVYRSLDSQPSAQLHFVAHYMVDESGAYFLAYDEDGRYASGLEQAWEILDPLPVRELKRLVRELMGENEQTAVPKA